MTKKLPQKELKKLDSKPTGAYIPLSRLRRIVRQMDDRESQLPITFEFLMGSCFPTIYDTIQARLTDEYTQGYIQGYKDANNETNKCN